MVRVAADDGDDLIAPAPARAEWRWAGEQEKGRAAILRAFKFEAPTLHIARLAGSAMGLVGAGLGDALIMAAASIYGDVVTPPTSMTSPGSTRFFRRSLSSGSSQSSP